MPEIYEIETRKVKVKILPCIKCGSDKVETWNCGYSSFNSCGVKCLKCGHKVNSTYSDWDAKPSQIVKNWNIVNNPQMAILKLDEQIGKLQLEKERITKLVKNE